MEANMTYESVAFISQMVSLALFGSVMIGVVIYAFRPANKARFNSAARLALEHDNDLGEGSKNGRS
jgi:cbb3-type cytochrome oxidase subunit 3